MCPIFLLLAVSWASFPSRLRIFRESLLCVSFAPCMRTGEGRERQHHEPIPGTLAFHCSATEGKVSTQMSPVTVSAF